MSSNYIITVNNDQTFGGWGRFGEILINDKDRSNLAYRMTKTLATRTVPKIEAFLKEKGISNRSLEIKKIA